MHLNSSGNYYPGGKDGYRRDKCKRRLHYVISAFSFIVTVITVVKYFEDMAMQKGNHPTGMQTISYQ